jgi:thermitase
MNLIKLAFTFAAVSTCTSLFASSYIIKYRSPELLVNFTNANFLKVIHQHKPGKLYKVDINEDHKDEVIKNLKLQKNIEYIVRDAKVYPTFVPKDNQPPTKITLREQWAIKKVQAEKAWELAGNKGSKNITVAIIDTGADYKHIALAPNMVKGYDFIHNNENPMDVVSYGFPGHGTHCSGIVGATGLKDKGTIGMSPVVSIMPLRFIDDEGGEVSNGIRAIDYAIEKKVDVISASWSGAMEPDESVPLTEAIARAEKAGIIFVTAASNEGKNNDINEIFPANVKLPNVISVAASDADDKKPEWSNYGKASVHLAAPGDEILSTLPGNWYGGISGTSMSAPLVAGLIAFIKAQNNTLNPVQMKSLLQASADKANIDTACNCRVNAANAIDTVLKKKMFVSPFAGTMKTIGSKMQFEAVFGVAPFTYSVSNSKVASIDNNGLLTATGLGDVKVSIVDANGVTASSYNIYVTK